MTSSNVHHGFIHEFIHTSVISACTTAGLFKHEKQVHAFILKTEENPKPEFLLSVNNALVTLYWKCGKVDEARKIFDKMLIRNLVSWNEILPAYVNLGRIMEAKSFFKEMPEEFSGMDNDDIWFSTKWHWGGRFEVIQPNENGGF